LLLPPFKQRLARREAIAYKIEESTNRAVRLRSLLTGDDQSASGDLLFGFGSTDQVDAEAPFTPGRPS